MIGGTREVMDTRRTCPTESTHLDSWGLTETKELLGVWTRSSACVLWLSSLVLLWDSWGILVGFWCSVGGSAVYWLWLIYGTFSLLLSCSIQSWWDVCAWSYCTILHHVWLMTLGDLFFFWRETECGMNLDSGETGGAKGV